MIDFILLGKMIHTPWDLIDYSQYDKNGNYANGFFIKEKKETMRANAPHKGGRHPLNIITGEML